MQSRKVLLTSLPQLLSRLLSLSSVMMNLSGLSLSLTRKFLVFRIHQGLSLSDHGEKEPSLPVYDYGIEQVLWGTDCCQAMVVPEQGAGAVEPRSRSRCIAFLQFDLLLPKTLSSKCQREGDILDNKALLPCLPL